MKLCSLIIPCYNEAKNLPLLAERLRSLDSRGDIEIILVNNGSKDNSSEVMSSISSSFHNLRVVNVEINQGYGFGILQGLKAGTGRFLAWTHADMQTDPKDLIAGLELVTSSQEPEKVFVKGRRYGRPLGDVFFTVGMSIFETLLLGRFVWDINAQPVIFSKTFFDSWKNPPYDFSLDLFAYYNALVAGLKVKRFPVYFGLRAHGESSWNRSFSLKMKFIRRTLEYSFKMRRSLTI